ncbi:MAG: ABC transporter ATP-binding protein [Desulfobulbaceae bacterium]|nr:ABC transporter ATP-binding protein [Desulfobulbaceae bacterium]
MNSEILLDIQDLEIEFHTAWGRVRVADRISFTIKDRETICLLGESGSGKSVIALAVLGLLPDNAVVRGKIYYRGRELLSLSAGEKRRIRGREIAMIFEQPMGCLNPVMSIGAQIVEALAANSERRLGNKELREEALRRLDEVGMTGQSFNDYPHELSGGMQQRVMIAMALACRPKLLIADEPTTALDLTVQRQILDLLNDLKQHHAASLLIITHDPGIAAEMSDSVAVMYAGTLMEHTGVQDFFQQPVHPYSQALHKIISGKSLQPIPGDVPNLMELPTGCPFHPRCERAGMICRTDKPESTRRKGTILRCHYDRLN